MAAGLGAQAHRIMHMDFGGIGGSALTDASITVPRSGEATTAIPVTYVPARNTVMLAVALGWAEVLGADGGRPMRRGSCDRRGRTISSTTRRVR